MIPRLQDERDALAHALMQLEAPELTIYRYWPDIITPPCLMILPVRPNFDTFNGYWRLWQVQLLVPQNNLVAAQMQADQYLEYYGPKSVWQALTVDPTFGGICANSTVDGWHQYGGRRTEQGSYVGAYWGVEMYPNRD